MRLRRAYRGSRAFVHAVISVNEIRLEVGNGLCDRSLVGCAHAGVGEGRGNGGFQLVDCRAYFCHFCYEVIYFLSHGRKSFPEYFDECCQRHPESRELRRVQMEKHVMFQFMFLYRGALRVCRP